jgi:hypothetical protein
LRKMHLVRSCEIQFGRSTVVAIVDRLHHTANYGYSERSCLGGSGFNDLCRLLCARLG